MKSTLTLLLSICTSLTVCSQSILGPMQTAIPKPVDITLGSAGSTQDTLGLEDFLLSTPAVYTLPGRGYATGTFLSVDTFLVPNVGAVDARTRYHAFAEGHLVGDQYSVTGAMFFLGALQQASANPPDIIVNLHLVEDNMAISDPATVSNPDIPGPGQIVASDTVPFSNLLDTVSGGEVAPNFVDFDNAPVVDYDIIISMDISAIYDVNPLDTVAVLANSDGEGDGEYTFHRLNQVLTLMDGTPMGSGSIWAPTSTVVAAPGGVGLDINFALFPIVTEPVGVSDIGFFNGIRSRVFPNPAFPGQDIRIDYDLKSASDHISINVYDMNGKLMASFNENSLPAGSHNVLLNGLVLPAGEYIYSIQADEMRFAKKFVVVE